VGVDQLVGRGRRLGEDPEPGEGVLPEEVRTDLSLGDQEPRAGPGPVRADHEVALQRLLPALLGEPDRRPLAVEPLDLRVAHPEPDVPAVGKPPRDEVDQHLVLGVHHHRPAAGELVHVDPVQTAGEGQVDAVVDEAVAHHPVAHPGLAHQVHGALLEDPGLDRLLDVLPGLQVDHHRFDAAQVQQVRQHQPGRPGPHDPHLRAHVRPLSLGSLGL
jgi:hypothetical protein